jgi:hypothetical protein
MKKLGKQPPTRLQLLIDSEDLEVIEDYQHQVKINGRSAAIRELIRAGLKAEEAAGKWKMEESKQ